MKVHFSSLWSIKNCDKLRDTFCAQITLVKLNKNRDICFSLDSNNIIFTKTSLLMHYNLWSHLRHILHIQLNISTLKVNLNYNCSDLVFRWLVDRYQNNKNRKNMSKFDKNMCVKHWNNLHLVRTTLSVNDEPWWQKHVGLIASRTDHTSLLMLWTDKGLKSL